jgi:hypothetical protein
MNPLMSKEAWSVERVVKLRTPVDLPVQMEPARIGRIAVLADREWLKGIGLVSRAGSRGGIPFRAGGAVGGTRSFECVRLPQFGQEDRT